MQRPTKALLISDVHFSNEDEGLVNLVVFKFGRELQPDIIFLNGDIIDNYAVSHYQKHPNIEQSLKKDVDSTKKFLRRLRTTFPNAEIVYVFGNHCHRLETYLVERAPELFPYVNLEQILELKKLRIKCVRSSHKENWYKYKNLYIGHYDCAKSTSAATAQYLLRTKGVNVLQGHVHRVGMTATRLLDRTIYGYENPCLTKMDADYIKDPNWMQGASVLYFTDTEHWWYPIVIKGRQFVWNGKVYRAEK